MKTVGLVEKIDNQSYGCMVNCYAVSEMLKQSGADEVSVVPLDTEVDGLVKEEEKRKIYFGVSVPEGEKIHAHAVSVTEKRAWERLRTNGIKAELTAEPVLCLSAEQWERLAERSEKKLPDKYMLSYLSTPDKSKRKLIQFYRRKMAMPCLNIVDGMGNRYGQNQRMLDLKDTLPVLKTEDFVKYFAGSSYVITDDSRGVYLAAALHKPILYIGSDETVMELLQGQGVIFDTEVLSADFIHVSGTEEQVAQTYAWLHEVLEAEELPSISVGKTDRAVTATLRKELCVGCSACAAVCPKGALTLQQDEYGYYVRSIDHDKCINCGLCSKTCPVLSKPVNSNREEPDCYACVAADEEIVMKSSSGGVFTLLAEEIFRRGGVVIGGAWNDRMTISHTVIESREQLDTLRKSKYMQSDMGSIFQTVKQYLQEGRWVLFSGCGCQAAGLKAYLKKDYERLLVVDIFCHYAPSAGFFQKYREDCLYNAEPYEFRYKEGEHCWDCLTVKIGGQEVRRGGAEDEFQRVFHTEVMLSEHCEKCRFQTRQRFGDVTLGDFWGVQKHDSTIPFGRGVSCVLLNNAKGQTFFDSLPQEQFRFRKQEPLAWVGGNGMVRPDRKRRGQPARDFYHAVRFMPFQQAANYALKSDRSGQQPSHGRNPLQFESKAQHFQFDSHVWQETMEQGTICLRVKAGQVKPGNYAVMPLNRMLEPYKTYRLYARFRFKSDSKVLNFHIKDSGTKLFKVIAVHKAEHNTGTDWIEIDRTFVPSSDIFDELMFGASQIKGEGAFLAIDSICISEA